MNPDKTPKPSPDDRLANLAADMLIERERRTSDGPKKNRRIVLFFGTLLIVGCIVLGFIKGKIIGLKAAFPYVHLPASQPK